MTSRARLGIWLGGFESAALLILLWDLFRGQGSPFGSPALYLVLAAGGLHGALFLRDAMKSGDAVRKD